MSGFIQSTVMGLAQGMAEDKANEYAAENFQFTKDPYYVKLPNGDLKRRKLPEYCTKQESKNWKKLQTKAWTHDKSMCGCCCWTECIGWVPLLAIIPVIGPGIMYTIHNSLIKFADRKFNLPIELKVKMHSNIAIDLVISLVPLLGVFFSWLNACSTRNAALVYNFVSQRALERHNMQLSQQQQGSNRPNDSRGNYSKGNSNNGSNRDPNRISRRSPPNSNDNRVHRNERTYDKRTCDKRTYDRDDNQYKEPIRPNRVQMKPDYYQNQYNNQYTDNDRNQYSNTQYPYSNNQYSNNQYPNNPQTAPYPT